MFRTAMQRAWDEGKHLLIANEALSIIGTEDPNRLSTLNATSGTELLQRLLDILPKSPNREIYAAIEYRTPRITHYQSLWREYVHFNEETQRMPFSHFVVTLSQRLSDEPLDESSSNRSSPFGPQGHSTCFRAGSRWVD